MSGQPLNGHAADEPESAGGAEEAFIQLSVEGSADGTSTRRTRGLTRRGPATT
jgi:hypothetical protein